MGIILVTLIIIASFFLFKPVQTISLLVYGPLILASKPWSEKCKKDPINSYLSGSYAPCTGSPLTEKNANTPLPHANNGICPLLLAIGYGNVPAVEELLRLGAKPELCSGFPDGFYYEVSSASNRNSQDTIAKLLTILTREKIVPSDPQALLINSIKESSILTANLAIKLGANANKSDNNGLPPLYYACIYYHGINDSRIKIVSLLISNGADPNFKTSSGLSIYQLAKKDYKEIGNWPKLEKELLNYKK